MLVYKSNTEGMCNIIVFLLLFLTSSFVVTNNIISSSLTIGLWVILFIFALLGAKMKVKTVLFYSAVIISALMLVTDLLCGENITTSAKNIFAIIIICFVASAMTFEKFSTSYVKVMKFLCVTSLIGYFLHLLIPGIFNLFSSTYGSGTRFANLIIYIQYLGDNSSLYRNFGFTWEPGAFVTFVCLALLLDFFVVSKEIHFKSILLYFVTAVTTFSTTGIIAMLCLCLYIVFVNKNKSAKYAIAFVLSLSIILTIVFSDLLFSTANYSTFGKLILYFNSDGEKASSVGIRFNSMTKVFEAFLKRPIFGWGYDGLRKETYEYTNGIITCTFANWFGLYGVVFGSIMWSYMYLLSKRISYGGINRFIVFLFLFGITSTENYARNAFFIMLAFYGMLEFRKNRNSNTCKLKKKFNEGL